MIVFREARFFSADQCRRVREAMDRGTAEAAEILVGRIDVDDQVRRTEEIDVDAATLECIEAALDARRDRIAAFHGVALGDREGASVLRYRDGGFYKPHRDRAASPAWPDAARRRIAVVVFLNDGFSGGVLRLWPDAGAAVDLVPEEGMLVAFDAAMLHEVLPVTGGTRDTVVDWFYDL